MLAEGKTNGDEVRVIVYCPDDMTTLVSTACAGAATRSANIINVKIEKDHFGLFCFRKGCAEYRVQATSGVVAVECDAFDLLL